jgi:hypothetical protein
MLRLDRTKPLIYSAAELVPFRFSPGRNIKQSSPSAFGGPHLFGKCEITQPPHHLGGVRIHDARYSSRRGPLASAIRDAEAVSLLRAAALKK